MNMITKFLDGEVYSNPKYEDYVMVLGVGEESETEVVLAILWVDKESKQTTFPNELVVKKSSLPEWFKVDL